MPPEATLVVQAVTPTSALFRWPRLSIPSINASLGAGPTRRPLLECQLQISRRESEGRQLELQTSLLVEEDDGDGDCGQLGPPTEITAFGLWPGAEYHAELLVRLSRLGPRTWQSPELSAWFIMP